MKDADPIHELKELARSFAQETYGNGAQFIAMVEAIQQNQPDKLEFWLSNYSTDYKNIKRDRNSAIVLQWHDPLDGNTLLHLLAFQAEFRGEYPHQNSQVARNNKLMWEMLIEAGADPSALNHIKQTPAQIMEKPEIKFSYIGGKPTVSPKI